MELTQILSELENYTEKFPRLALEEAIEKQEEITPLLLENITKWKDNLEELLELPEYFLHIYSFFLLAQFRETKAYPLIIDFFSVPGEITLDITGDFVTEDLARVLASVSGGNIEPVKILIENPQVNRYVRSSALQSLLILFVEDVISREVIIDYFKELFSIKLDEKDLDIWTHLVISSGDIYPLELKEDIHRVFAEDLIDSSFISLKNIDSVIEQGKDVVLNELRQNSHHHFVKDVIAEMEWWACFKTGTETQKQVIRKPKAIGLGKSGFSSTNKSNSSKKKNKTKMQKKSRQKNRSKKK